MVEQVSRPILSNNKKAVLPSERIMSKANSAIGSFKKTRIISKP
jgi:hypothetical protein